MEYFVSLVKVWGDIPLVSALTFLVAALVYFLWRIVKLFVKLLTNDLEHVNKHLERQTELLTDHKDLLIKLVNK